MHYCCLLVVSAVRNMQSLMLRQISAVVEDEVSGMPEPDIISQSPQQSQLISASFSYAVFFRSDETPHRTAPDRKILGDRIDQTPQHTGDPDALFQSGNGPTSLP